MTNQFNWLLYLDVADHLLNLGAEQFLRSATSRAYYGVFCHVRDILEQRQGHRFPPEGSVHKLVIDELKDDPRQAVAQLGNHLDRLRRERNRADYSAYRFTLSRGQKSMSLARSIQSGLIASLP